ncbi:MAG: hypothetical protein OHK0012_09830 [Synechococcales cyanobacterium]
MTRLHLWPALLLLSLLAGCGGRSSEAPIQEGSVDVNNPVAVMGELDTLTEKANQLAQDLENAKPVDPVSFQELVAWLPAAPSGWEASEPEGNQFSTGEWQVSQASRDYSQGDTSIRILVMDSAYNPSLLAPLAMVSSFSEESTQGYNKGITIGTYPGLESYEFEPRSGKLTVLVSKRFLVEIEGSAIEAEALREWWQKLDIAKLEQIAG